MQNKKDVSFSCSSNDNTLTNSLNTFNQIFSTAEDCYEHIYFYLKEKKQTACKICDNQLERRQYGDRLLSCNKCKKSISITKGTFFERTRKIRAWFKVIWLIESGLKINSTLISKVTTLSYSSAWELFHRVALLISENMDESSDLVSGILFSRIISRRSTETPARMPPADEYDYIEQSESLKSTTEKLCDSIENPNISEPNNVSSRSKEENTILEILSSEPISFDLICSKSNLPTKTVTATLAILELDLLVNSINGNRYSLKTNKMTSNTNGTKTCSQLNIDRQTLNYAESVVEYVKDVFKGISLKYLQNYLAVFWCHCSNKRWSSSSLFSACIKSTSYSYKEILECKALANVKAIINF